MKRLARLDKHPTVVAVPEVVGTTIVGIQPEIVLVAFDVEHVQVAVRVSDVCDVFLATIP